MRGVDGANLAAAYRRVEHRTAMRRDLCTHLAAALASPLLGRIACSADAPAAKTAAIGGAN